MDYDKINNDIDSTISKIENKAIVVFNRNLNFIRNLRRYITNEKEQFENTVILKSIKITLLLILIEGVLMFFGKESILGIYPKIITLILLCFYYNKVKQRGGQLNG